MIYIARDEDGQLMAFRQKPERDRGGKHWTVKDSRHLGNVPSFFAPGLRWQDDPIKVKMEVIN